MQQYDIKEVDVDVDVMRSLVAAAVSATGAVAVEKVLVLLCVSFATFPILTFV